MNPELFASFLSLMIAHVNATGAVDDGLFCKELAKHVHDNKGEVGYYGTLSEFIREFGEEYDEAYMGRDEDGEKQYHCFNPKTNWHDRIRMELVALGYYQESNLTLV